MNHQTGNIKLLRNLPEWSRPCYNFHKFRKFPTRMSSCPAYIIVRWSAFLCLGPDYICNKDKSNKHPFETFITVVNCDWDKYLFRLSEPKLISTINYDLMTILHFLFYSLMFRINLRCTHVYVQTANKNESTIKPGETLHVLFMKNQRLSSAAMRQWCVLLSGLIVLLCLKSMRANQWKNGLFCFSHPNRSDEIKRRMKFMHENIDLIIFPNRLCHHNVCWLDLIWKCIFFSVVGSAHFWWSCFRFASGLWAYLIYAA